MIIGLAKFAKESGSAIRAPYRPPAVQPIQDHECGQRPNLPKAITMPRLERLLPAKALLDEEPADWVMSGTSSKVNSSGWCHTIWGHGAGRTAVWSFARIMFIACHDVYRSHGKHTFPVAPAP